MKLRALAMAMLVGFAAITGPVTLTGVAAAANVGNTAISDPANGPIPGAGNVAVTHLDIRSDDAVVNDHDGTVDAQSGDTVGTFGSNAYYFDADGSTDYTTGDEMLLDNDGDAIYTASPDTLVSGLPVGSPVTTTDGFDDDWSLESYDADDSDGGWDASEDAIVIESGSGGTYSAGADTVLNPGTDSDVDVVVGATLRPTNDISGAASGPHLVDSNGNEEFDAGEDTVTDDDQDDQFTGQKDDALDYNGGDSVNDQLYGADEPEFDAPAGASLTGAETVSPAAGGDSPANGNALYYVDSDGSGDYTSGDEVVMDPNAGNVGKLVYDADGASDEDSDGMAGDDVLLTQGDDWGNSLSDGDKLHRFEASDHVAFEDSGHDGIDDSEYQEGEEIYVDYDDGGTVSTGPDTLLNEGDTEDRSAGDALVALNGLDSPSNLRWYDEDDNDDYDTGDELIVDEDEDGIYTGSADTLVAGTPPSAGTSLSTGQDGDWAIDAHDAIDGNDWERTTDGLFVDGGDGAYSTDDTLVAGERVPGGTSVTTADGFDADWSLDSFDADGTDGSFDASEDAIVYESRDNGEYTASTDTVLNAGSDDDVDSPAGTTVEPMGDIDSDYYLADSNGNGEFDAGEDVVCCDDDGDGQFTDKADTVVDTDGATSAMDYGTEADAELGDSLTGAETVSIPAGGADAGNELYYVDSDNSGDYTPTDEVVLDANADDADSLSLDTDDASDEDGDGVAGDDTILVYGSDDANGASEGDTLQQFQASDHVAFENTGFETGHSADGQYQNGEDILVDYYDGGTVSFDYALDSVSNDGGDQQVSGGDDLVRLTTLSTPSGIGWLDEDNSGNYGPGDEIIVDDDGDGAYTASTDLVVAGTAPSGGTSIAAGQDTDWAIDSYDDSDGGGWDGTTDALFIDKNGGGTFSTTTDTRINAGEDGTFDVSNGDPLADLDESTYGYVDLDGNGLDTGDEVYAEGDAALPSGANVYGEKLTSLKVEQVGSLDTQYIDSVDLYRDDGDDTLTPTTDTLVQSGASRSGTTYTFSGLSESVPTDETSYLISVDLADDAPEDETLEFEVPTRGITFTQDDSTGDLGTNALEIDTPTLAITSPSTLTKKTPDQPSDEDDDTLSLTYNYQQVGTDSTTVRLVSTTDADNYYEYRIPDSEYDDTTTSKSLTIDLDNDITGTGGSFTTNPEDFTDGEYDIELTVDDDDGGQFTTTSNRALVGIDDSPPTVSLATLQTTGTVDWSSGGSVSVDYAFSDSGPGTPDLEVTLADGNGNSVTNVYTDETATSGTKTFSQSDSFERTNGNGLVAGNSYEVSIRVVDDYGLSASSIDNTNTVTFEDSDSDPDPNEPPDATDDSYVVTENETLTVDTPGVLSNDTDSDGDALTATVATTPSNGALDLNTDGSFEYAPDTGFVGEDSFTYEVSDGNGGTDTATVTMTITESPPQPANFTVAITDTNAPVTEGENLSVTASVTNVGETADTQSVTLEAVDGTEVDNQSIALDAGNETNVTLTWSTGEDDDGSGTVTVRTADDTATRSATVDPSDDDGSSGGGGGGFDPNDPPDATDDSYTVAANATLSVTTDNGVLATDNDPDDDSDALSATVESGPANGTLALAANGSFVYEPDPGFVGTDSFTYEVSDDDGGVDTATVTITATTRPNEAADPTVIENKSAIRQQMDIPENATPIAAERVTIPESESVPVTANFTDATSVASVQFKTGTSGNLSVVEYADPPSTYGDVPGSTLVPLQNSGSPAVENTTAIVRTRVSQTALQTADVDASDVRISHRVDGNWELLNTTVVSEDDGAVVLEATTDGSSPFAVTAIKTPNASMTVTPTPESVDEELTLDASNATTPDGEIVSYQWSLNGQSLSGETATVTLGEAGEYTVELTVKNDAGQTATTTTTIAVENDTVGGETTPGDSTTPDSSTPISDDSTTTTDTPVNEVGPGFGIIITLVALIAIALIAHKRRS